MTDVRRDGAESSSGGQFLVAGCGLLLLTILLSALLSPLMERPGRRGDVTARPQADVDTRGARGLEDVQESDDRADRYARTWAVVIGIDAYAGGKAGLSPLQYAVNDARAFRDMLHAEFGYEPPRTRYLEDREATRAAIQETFQRWLPAQGLQAHDALLVFFSGHGLIDPRSREGYLAAVDSAVDRLPERCIAVTQLKSWLESLPCRHKLLILDSCYSGSLFLDKPATPAPTHLPRAKFSPPRNSRNAPLLRPWPATRSRRPIIWRTICESRRSGASPPAGSLRWRTVWARIAIPCSRPRCSKCSRNGPILRGWPIMRLLFDSSRHKWKRWC